MARAGIYATSGPQTLIRFAHDACSDFAQGNMMDQEVNILAGGTRLTRDNAIRLIESAHEYYCPAL
jgi:Protein of unknown function (DUF732)